jgi:exoribonuclease-2
MLLPGQVLEFIETGRVISGVCLEQKKNRVRALSETQREVQIAEARVVNSEETRLELGQTREALASTLRELSTRREELSRQVDVKGLWEVLQGEGQEFSARELAELAFGQRAGHDQVSAVIRAMLADRVYFRFRPEGFRPNPPETVEKILLQREREEQRERFLDEGSRWIRSLWDGKHLEAPVFQEEILELLKEHAIFGSSAPRQEKAQELLRRAGMNHPLASFNTLVRLGVWSRDENLLAHRFGIRRAFPPEVEQEARVACSCLVPQDEPWREDLTHLQVFTVDSPHTRDADDALSAELLPDGRVLVGIHITDVASRVPRESLLDKEAFRRGTSIYLPEERIPMFPPALSEEACSLRAGEMRPAVSLFLEVTKQGEVLGHRFSLSWLRVARRLSYEEVDLAVENGDQLMGCLHRIALGFRGQRVEMGALLLPLPEVTVRLETSGEIILERRDRESPAQILVSEMMIRANWIAALCMKQASVACLYRVQPEPRERLLEGWPQADLLRNYKQRKLLNRAVTQLEPGFHSGLGLSPYTTVTSPIRRYADLVVQRQLVAILKGDPPPFSPKDLETILSQCEEAASQAAQMEQARQRYWLLRYLEHKRGEETRGLVLGLFNKKLQVLLTDYMMETSVPAKAGGRLQEGQEVQVRILRARPLEDELKVELC